MASLTKTLAVELAETGVNVNALAPGVFPTDMSLPLVEGTPRGNEILNAHADAPVWESRTRSWGRRFFWHRRRRRSLLAK